MSADSPAAPARPVCCAGGSTRASSAAVSPAAPRRRAVVRPRERLQPRALRSRDALKRATREVLNERGYGALRAHDVSARAGVAAGLFYRYFRDRREIVAEVAADVFAELFDTPVEPAADHPYDWLYCRLRAAVDHFAANPGVLACLFGLAGDHDEFDGIWNRHAHLWNLGVSEFLQRTAGREASHAGHLAFVLGATAEGVIYQALIRRTDDLVRLARSPAEIAEVIAVLWYRAIFLMDPPADRLHAAGRRLTMAAPRRRSGR